MIELCADDTEATNLSEEETTMSDLLVPSTGEYSAQNIQDNPTTKDTSQLTPKYSQIPHRGVTKKQYKLDIKTNVKYPINNYVSFHGLLESYALIINQLCKVSIPNNLRDVLADSR